MSIRRNAAIGGLCAFAMTALWATPANAQSGEIKEKPPLYTLVTNWSIPRARWADMEKQTGANAKILEKALAGGSLVAYGNDSVLIHEADGETHDSFWSATSLAGLFNVLDELYKAGSPQAPVLGSATKHWDSVYVSRFYNWRPGTWTGAYTYEAVYRLKADAPDDTVELLSKSAIVPMFEKLLADGAINEYEIDTQAFHTEAPGLFTIIYISPNAEGLDKVGAALRQTLKAQPLAGPAFTSAVDMTAHRDGLSRTNATYK